MSTQPDPTPNTGLSMWQSMWQLVIAEYQRSIEEGVPMPGDAEGVVADMLAREATGRERYGVVLQAFNGRNPAQDAYEEALDLTVYLRQCLAEIDATGRDDQRVKAIMYYGVVSALLGDLRDMAQSWETPDA